MDRAAERSIENGYDVRLNFLLLDQKVSHGNRQVEPPQTCAARIEIENAVADFLVRSVTVAGDHDLEASGFGFQIEVGEIVEDVDRNVSDFENFSLGKLARPCVFVDVAANSSDRRDGRERF